MFILGTEGLWRTLWQPSISEALGSFVGTAIAGLILYWIIDSKLRPKLEKKSAENNNRIDTLKNSSKEIIKIINTTTTQSYKNWRHAFEDGLYFHGRLSGNFESYSNQEMIDAFTTVISIFEGWRDIGEANLIEVMAQLPDCSLKDKINLIQSNCKLLIIDIEILHSTLKSADTLDESAVKIMNYFFNSIAELINIIESLKKLSLEYLKNPYDYLHEK